VNKLKLELQNGKEDSGLITKLKNDLQQEQKKCAVLEDEYKN